MFFDQNPQNNYSEFGATKKKVVPKKKVAPKKKVVKIASPKTTKEVFAFVFQWVLPTSPTVFLGLTSFKSFHDAFNRDFVKAFPKLLYTNPSTSYTDEGYYSENSIHAVGETTLQGEIAKQKILAIAENAGFRGDFQNVDFSQKSIGQLQSGEKLTLPRSVVNTKPLTKANATVKQLNDEGITGVALDSISTSLLGEDIDVAGYKIPKLALVFGAALGVFLAIKRG